MLSHTQLSRQIVSERARTLDCHDWLQENEQRKENHWKMSQLQRKFSEIPLISEKNLDDLVDISVKRLFEDKNTSKILNDNSKSAEYIFTMFNIDRWIALGNRLQNLFQDRKMRCWNPQSIATRPVNPTDFVSGDLLCPCHGVKDSNTEASARAPTTPGSSLLSVFARKITCFTFGKNWHKIDLKEG